MDTKYIHDQAKIMAQKIDVLNLSPHAYDKLYWNGYRTLGKLSKLTVQDILKIDGIGKVYCSEIVEKAASAGIIIQDNSVVSENKHLKNLHHLPYPNNLLLDVMGSTPDSDVTLDPDRIAGISFALHRIDDRSATMVLLRYKHLASFSVIGSYFGISDSRAQQIVDKTILRLRRPAYRILLTEGLRGYMQSEISKHVEERVAARLQGEYRRGFIDGVNEAKKEEPTSDIKTPQSPYLSLPIEDMELSIRSFNCLKRAGKNNLGDLLTYQNSEDIYKIRNLGKKSIIEIATKIQSYGFINTAWDEFLHSDVSIYKSDTTGNST